MGIHTSKSTKLGLITRGYIWGLMRPWEIEFDTQRKYINVVRRNWHLISKDEDSYQFSSVRHFKINNSIFGADLHIKMYQGAVNIRGISKKSAKIIRDILLGGQAKQDSKGNRNGGRNTEVYIDHDNNDF